MKHGIRVKGLHDQVKMTWPQPFLFCKTCQSEVSANAGDYFMARPDSLFICCGLHMILVTKSVHYHEVQL